MTLCILYGRVCHFFVPPANWVLVAAATASSQRGPVVGAGWFPPLATGPAPSLGNQVMANRLSDYSSECHRNLLRYHGLEVVSRADAETAVPPSSIISLQRVFRLPHLIILAGIEFARDYAAACLEKAKEFPGRPLPDPWSIESERALVAAVLGALSGVRYRVTTNWDIPPREAAILADIARGELYQWISDAFEAGRDAFYGAVSPQNTATSCIGSTDRSDERHPASPVKRRKKRRGNKTDERLAELMASREGREQILAAGGARELGKLIDRSPAAVVGSPVWQKEISPLIETCRANSQLARREWDARRRDRN